MKIISLILTITPLIYTGCYMGASTYEIFKKNMDLQIGRGLYPGMKDRKKIYDGEYDIYSAEYPKGCNWGYLVKRNDEKKTIVGWKIISGEEYCKEQQAYSLF
ncbi:hypothetical protein [Sulfurospirillum barnesii]|uniref:Uncharacterized protein n=1 Tax=Sulfurospirillum barnesii (strain ATCC 700032 / DSM 10660 / SES-3) TaxID=760154 RepID=I3XXI5_SULBS|nr:hypothetical protein [Sulfurospirillum barnesii]AFL68659.1 hypothetical protein Sulba_1370 [Sulfurospirillum barnesii SES-3]